MVRLIRSCIFDFKEIRNAYKKEKYHSVHGVCAFVCRRIFAVRILPREKYSDSERRMLNPMPNLSIKQIMSGRFMSDFESYSVDAFPFRDSFRRIKAAAAASVFLRQDNHGLYLSGGVYG